MAVTSYILCYQVRVDTVCPMKRTEKLNFIPFLTGFFSRRFNAPHGSDEISAPNK